MRVMVLVPSFGRVSPVAGVLQLARYLSEAGDAVVFGSLDREYQDGRHLLDDIRAAGLPSICFEASGWSGLAAGVARLRRYLQREGLDAIVSCLLRPDLVTAAVPGVVRVSSVRIPTRPGLRLSHGRLIAAVATRIHMAAIRRMDGVFSMSDDMTAYLRTEGVPAARIHTVNNFVDVEALGRYGVNERRGATIELGLFGGLIRRKRPELAVEALALLAAGGSGRSLRLHIVGDGPLGASLARLAAERGVTDRVVFHGHLDDPFPVMARMDLVLLSSESEGTPRCLLEAMAMGKTCIASAIGGVRHLVIEGKTGYPVPPGDAAALAAKIDEVVGGARYLDPAGLRQFMRENFDVHVQAEEMRTRLAALVRHRHQRRMPASGPVRA